MPKCKITVLEKQFFPQLAAEYCANPKVGPCSLFQVGEVRILDSSDYFNMQIPNGFCSEAWHSISHYVYAALQGGSIMSGWMKDEKVMIACCNDGTRPVVFKLERLDEE